MIPDRFHAVIVDDDPSLLDGLRRALRAEPYDLHTAGNAEEGLGLIVQYKPDVIVSDFQLPGARGTVLLTRAKELMPDSCRILMTGSPTLTMAVEAINHGAVSRLFLKPFPTILLAQTMRDALERAEIARLSLRLVAQAEAHQHIIDRVTRLAPHLLVETESLTVNVNGPATGAGISDEYQPHDHANVLHALRRSVRQ